MKAKYTRVFDISKFKKDDRIAVMSTIDKNSSYTVIYGVVTLVATVPRNHRNTQTTLEIGEATVEVSDLSGVYERRTAVEGEVFTRNNVENAFDLYFKITYV